MSTERTEPDGALATHYYALGNTLRGMLARLEAINASATSNPRRDPEWRRVHAQASVVYGELRTIARKVLTPEEFAAEDDREVAAFFQLGDN